MNYVRVVLATALALAAVAVPLEAATATWDRNPESTVTGYRLSYGTQSGVHPTTINVGNVVTYQFFPPTGFRYYVVVQAYNASGTLSPKSAEVVLDLTVSQPPPPTQNQPPVLTQPANQSSVRNTAVSLTLIASDPQGTAVSFSASGLPPGLTINASTGVISGTVSTVGTYNVTATASDGSLSATRTFSWTVTSSSSSSTQTTVVLSPTDTSIDVFGANYVDRPKLYAYTFPANRVGQAILMKFDLSQIPAGALIQSATLELALVDVDSNTTDPNYTVSLHQVINRNPDLTRATGLTANGTTNWTANTCCYQNVPMAQSDISPARAVTVVNRTLGVKTWDALSLVQAWRTTPATNYGLLLNADTTKGSDRYRAFGSAQNETAASRPSLRIVYSTASTTTTAAQTMSVSSAVAGGTTTTTARTATVTNTPTTRAAAATQPATDASVDSLAASTAVADSVDEGELAVAGDFDGDGRPDPATYHRATGEWRIRLSSTNFNVAAPIVWGVSSDVPVAADYDGDRRTDIAVYRPSTGTWHVLLSSTNMQSRLELQWGDASDSPLPIDHDRDGRADLALPRAGGFEILLSGSNYRTSVTVR